MYIESDFVFKTSQSLFGTSHLHHVVDKTEKTEVLNFFTEHAHIKLPNSKKDIIKINKSNVNILENKEYYSTNVPDDLDFYIFITHYKKKNMVFLISRFTDFGFDLPKIILGEMNILKNDYYKNTVFEATRVRCVDGRFLFLATDIILNKGEIIKSTYIERLCLLGELFKNDYKECLHKFPFRFQIVKTFQNLNDLMTHSTKLPYTTNRILFRENYTTGKNKILSFETTK